MANQLNQQLTGKVIGISDDGSGVIESPRKPIFAYNTIPGETVTVTTKRKMKDGIQATLDHVDEPSVHRVQPLCPYAGVCGGCKWQHVDYDFQRAMKLSLVKQTFAEHDIDLPLERIEGCPEPFYYRNRMDYVFGRDGSLGLKEPGRWWSVLDLQSCFLLSKDGVDIMHRVRDWARGSGLPFWDLDTHEGFFRYLVIREGKNTGERLVMLVTNRPGEHETVEQMRQELVPLLEDKATSILWGINDRMTDLSVADEIHALKGEPYLEEVVNGLRYRIAPNSFFQTNTLMAAKLQDAVKTACEPLADKSVLDLYCGAGFFTLALTGARRLMGIELDAAAIDAAKINAELNGLKADFHAAKVEDVDWIKHCPQVVILDPPRAGLHPHVLKTLRLALPARIIYVSCNYGRFAQELAILLEHYRISSVQAFDLFPHTPHVELVTILDRI